MSPLVAEPFLAKKICVPISNSSTESTMQQEFTGKSSDLLSYNKLKMVNLTCQRG